MSRESVLRLAMTAGAGIRIRGRDTGQARALERVRRPRLNAAVRPRSTSTVAGIEVGDEYVLSKRKNSREWHLQDIGLIEMLSHRGSVVGACGAGSNLMRCGWTGQDEESTHRRQPSCFEHPLLLKAAIRYLQPSCRPDSVGSNRRLRAHGPLRNIFFHVGHTRLNFWTGRTCRRTGLTHPVT